MRRIDAIEPFRVMQLLERAKALEAAGRDIVHMEIGEPDFPTPAPIIAEAHKALDARDTFYTPSTGLPALKSALAAWYKDEYGVDVAPERILITPGTSGGFDLLYHVILEAGESVLLPDPGYPCQRNLVRLAEGVPLSIPVGPESNYHLDAALLQTHWRDDTRAAVVISPGNPTGTLIKSEVLAELAAACREHGGWLISDEIYHGLTYGCEAATALQFSQDAIVVNGFSKRWAMTGWRVGWMIVPESLIDPCRRVMQNIFIAAPTLSQHAAIAALAATAEVEAMRREYDRRRRYLLRALPPLGFDIVVEPRGAFYIYANIEGISHDARAFCRDTLERSGVAITPGEDFGSHLADTHVRFSYATALDRLAEGVRRLGEHLGSI